MASNADPGAAAPTPVTSNTQTVSLPASLQPPGATGNFTVPVSANGAQFTSITVLVPIASGIRFGKEQTLLPGEAAKLDGPFTVSYMIDPLQIIFHSGPPAATPTLTSAVVSSSAAPAASVTSDPPQSSISSPTLGTTTSTSIANPNPQLQTTNEGLSTGATAGIAIGCFAAGTLLAGLIFWFCRRKRRRPNTQYPAENTSALASQEKGFSASAIPLSAKRSSVAALGSGLPQPLEDKAISGDVSKISNAIKNHVQSYYHTSRVNPGLIEYEDLHALGSGLPVSVGTLTTLIGNAATRDIALRFIIAWVVVSKLQPSKDPTKSFLPAEVAQCYQAVATGDRGYQAQTSLMARWRVMTAELMQSSYIRNAFGPSDSRHPYADSRINSGERKRNLEEVLKRAALFAFTLFSQPSAWEFEWQEEQGVTSGDLCIFPALVQVADEAGHPVNPPRPFSEAVVRRLDA
ncbi:hypothetical protein J4E91_005179 [Alternaria rosae]|nr:hypothetical protein J4E91_005179 [Alternaria rosae]